MNKLRNLLILDDCSLRQYSLKYAGAVYTAIDRNIWKCRSDIPDTIMTCIGCI